MNNDNITKLGLGNGRDWNALPDDGRQLEWSVDPENGLAQGPLDLEFLRGRKLSLTLEPAQMALLIEAGEIRAVYLDGHHYLDVGTGSRQIAPSCQLVFLASERSLTMRWSTAAPLSWGPEAHESLIGTCRLTIDAPDRFYHTFVAGAESCEDTVVLRLIEQIMRGIFEDLFSPVASDGTRTTCADLQSRLPSLQAADLNDDLAPYGLSCRHLAVYTAQPPVSEDERAASPAANAGGLQTSGLFDGIGHN